MIDGVRWSYLDENGLNGFPTMQKEGVRAKYVLPVFPSNTYPNWLTIVTGVFPENHGFVNNYMYDKNKNKYFEGYSSEHFWWNDVEPIWITAERKGIKSALFNWDGCELEFNGIKASFCQPYRSYKEWPSVEDDTRRAIFKILDLFQNGYKLGLVYYEPIDGTGHIFGPDSWIRKMFLRRIDKILYDIQVEIEKKGMADIFMDLINANLEGLQVYKKNDVPEIFHFRNHSHIAPIIMVTNSSDYIIIPLNTYEKMKPFYLFGKITSFFLSGIHGCNQYNDKMSDMRAIFIARGPAFKKKLIHPPLHMVDHYNVFCHILGIEPLPNNGSWSRVKDMFVL